MRTRRILAFLHKSLALCVGARCLNMYVTGTCAPRQLGSNHTRNTHARYEQSCMCARVFWMTGPREGFAFVQS